MNHYLVTPTIKTHQTNASLTYHSESAYKIGSVVLVEIGKKQVTAIIIDKVAKPDFRTKPITRVIEVQPLPKALIKLAEWLSRYYYTHPSVVWQSLLPRGQEKTRRKKPMQPLAVSRKRTNIVLNNQQQKAIETIQKMSAGTALLRGITGSGKTQVYIELAKKVIQQDKRSVVLLLPEIALTSQIIAEFTHDFPNIIVTHSRMSEAERHRAWQVCLASNEPLLVIGPRSALFSPLKNIGLVIIDECHEPSFKQNKSPRYSALRAAAKLTHYHQAKLVLGSATPSIADYFLAKHAGRPVLQLTKLALPQAKPATVTIVDMTNQRNFTKHRFLSNQLLTSITNALENQEQILIFHNRRGSAPVTLCDRCGWRAQCAFCFVPLVLHADTFKLMCHVCGRHRAVPTKCPECDNPEIIHKGIGTKLVEEELKKQFSGANIQRFDGDSLIEETLEKQYQEVYNGKVNIIVGTQVVAKGLDLPKLSTVGIIQADSGLALPDFQASERVFQLVTQASGRVGRNQRSSTVIIQTYQPDHPSIKLATTANYETFYQQALKELRRGNFPPFVYLLKLTCVYKTEAGAIKAAKELARILHTKAGKDVAVLGPTPAFYERLGNTYRWQLVLKSRARHRLIELLPYVPANKWYIELDPINLL